MGSEEIERIRKALLKQGRVGKEEYEELRKKLIGKDLQKEAFKRLWKWQEQQLTSKRRYVILLQIEEYFQEKRMMKFLQDFWKRILEKLGGN